MGKRTSDFMALAAIVGGAGLGLGLTSLYSNTAPMARMDNASVEVHIVPGRALGREGSLARTMYFRSRVRESGPDRAQFERIRVFEDDALRIQGMIESLDRERLDQFLAQAGELRRATGELELGELKVLLESVEGLESLENLELGENPTIEIIRSEIEADALKRRRRGRRPREAAGVPDSEEPGS